MWFRCCLYCVFALCAIGVGYAFGLYVPKAFLDIITKESLNDILKIVASSMLAVTIFSMSILVQAFNAAASTASPRANKLLMENDASQNALGTFIGAFLFSVVAIVGIKSKLDNQGAVFILFVFTAVIILLVIVMLLKWIDQLSKLGRVTVTIDMVERALSNAITTRTKTPSLGARLLDINVSGLEQHNHPVCSKQIGYVQYIDVSQLNNIATKHE